MRKPQGYDSAQAYTGDFQSLPPGGYICKIIKAAEQTTKDGRPMLTLLLDIAEGDYKGYFRKQYDSMTNNSAKKWPNGGTYRQPTEGKSLEYFKGLITCIEKSNLGYIAFDSYGEMDEKQLAGKLIGCVFGREQYKKNDGTLSFATKIFQTRSIEAIKAGIEAPADKLLEPEFDEAAHYQSMAKLGEEVQFDDNEIPF